MSARISTSPETEELRKKEEENRHAADVEDMKLVLATPHGLRFVQRIMDASQIFAVGFFGNSKDAFYAGRRAFGLAIYVDVVENCPQFLTRLARKPKELRATATEPEEE